MSVRVYVPRDSAALSVGAEGLARAIASEASSRGLDITLVRNGSRGMFWLEPLVEVETPGGRVAYGPVLLYFELEDDRGVGCLYARQRDPVRLGEILERADIGASRVQIHRAEADRR